MTGISLAHGWYSRPFFGERVSGDGVFRHQAGNRSLFAVIDGLGHGAPAGEMTRRIIDALQYEVENEPDRILDRLHSKFAGDLGAVMGVLLIDTSSGQSAFAGIGDTTTHLVSESQKSLLSGDGILGLQYRPGPTQRFQVRPGDMIMMHSDGVRKVQFEEVRTYVRLSPPVVAKKTVIKFGTDFDDATCLVIKASKQS